MNQWTETDIFYYFIGVLYTCTDDDNYNIWTIDDSIMFLISFRDWINWMNKLKINEDILSIILHYNVMVHCSILYYT